MAEGKLYLFLGIDRTAKFSVAQLVATTERKTARVFLQHMREAVHYRVHTIFTDRAIGTPLVQETMARGIQFAEQPWNRDTIYSRPMRFDMICEVETWFPPRVQGAMSRGIGHRLTKPQPSVDQRPSQEHPSHGLHANRCRATEPHD